MKKIKPLGILVLTVAAVVIAGAAKQKLLPTLPRRLEAKSAQWETVEGREGPDLYRTPVPSGWLVFSPESALVFVPDPDHEWLKR